MSKSTALLIGGTKMVERHLRRALPDDLDMVSLRTLDQAMRRMDEGGVSLLVFGPTLRRTLALVQTMRADARYRTVPLVVVYRDDQRSDVTRHLEGRAKADGYVMQSRAQRELEAAVKDALTKQNDGLGATSDLLEELPLEAVSALTTEISEAALAARDAAAAAPIETTLEFDAIEEIDEDVSPDETSTVMLDVVALDDELEEALPEELPDAEPIEELALEELEEIGSVEALDVEEIETVVELDEVGAEVPVELVELEEIVAEAEEVEPLDVTEVGATEDLLEEIEAIDELAPFEASTVTDIEAEAAEEIALEDAEEVLPEALPLDDLEELAVEELEVDDAAVEELAVEELEVEDVAVEDVAVQDDAVEEVALEEVAVEAEPEPEPASKAQRSRHASSTELLTSNLHELTSLIGKLQTALADIERLENENAELRDAKEAAEARAGSGGAAEAKLAEAEAAAKAAAERTAGAEADAASARTRAEAAEQALEAAKASAEAAAARVTTIEADLKAARAELSKRDDAAAAAAALLREAASRLVPTVVEGRDD